MSLGLRSSSWRGEPEGGEGEIMRSERQERWRGRACMPRGHFTSLALALQGWCGMLCQGCGRGGRGWGHNAEDSLWQLH